MEPQLSELRKLSPRAKRTVRDIQRAAWKLATEREPADISVEEIAEQAGVSRRTLFNYFSTKSSIFVFRFDTDDEVLNQFAQGMEPDLLKAIFIMVRSRLETVINEIPSPFVIVPCLFKDPDIIKEFLAYQRQVGRYVRQALATRLKLDPDSSQAKLYTEIIFTIERSIIHDHLIKRESLADACEAVSKDFRQILNSFDPGS